MMIYTFSCQGSDICRHLSVVKSNILIPIIPPTFQNKNIVTITHSTNIHNFYCLKIYITFPPGGLLAGPVKCYQYNNIKIFILEKREKTNQVSNISPEGKTSWNESTTFGFYWEFTFIFRRNKWLQCPGSSGGISRITIKIRSLTWTLSVA